MNASLSFRKSFLDSEVALAVGIIAILAIMLLPLPAFMMDMLLALNITIAIVVLFVSLYSIEPLDFSTFPSILLITTLFRLSLNIASTRLILLHGNTSEAAAGHIIKAFGTTIVGGDYVVGFIVFLILILINFIVITKGAGRIAEVAARFALDAMPGKQMAIDADLNAGIINDKIAQERRGKIQRESDFYGAMDGASKFVRGDAIAGLVITIINIAGGLIIGVLVHNISLERAVSQYTILTIGDGLVTQIPALVISTAAGITVSKAGRQNHLGLDFNIQLFSNYRILALVGMAVLSFIVIPGTPNTPFILLGLTFLYFSWRGYQQAKALARQELAEANAQPLEEKCDDLSSIIPLDLLSLELGYGLIPLVDTDQDGELLERIRAIRKQIALEYGFVVPAVHIKDNLSLEAGQYSFMIKGIEISKGEMMLNHLMAMKASETDEHLPGQKTIEPAFGLPAVWVTEDQKENAQIAGYTVVDIPTVMTTHLTEVIKAYAPEFLQRQDVQKLLDQIAATQPKLIEELVPNILSLGVIQRVLQGLLKEGVSVRDLGTILETLADYGVHTKLPDVLVEFVRQALSKSITKQYTNPDGVLSVLVLSQKLEKNIADAIQDSPHGSYLAMDPALAQQIISQVKNQSEKVQELNYQPIILCNPKVRPHLKKLTERSVAALVVLSHNEVSYDAMVETLGKISLKVGENEA